MEWLIRMAEFFLRKRREMKRWHRVVTTGAIIAVFIATYALVLPAITIDKETTENTPGMRVESSKDGSSEDRTSSSQIKKDSGEESATSGKENRKDEAGSESTTDTGLREEDTTTSTHRQESTEKSQAVFTAKAKDHSYSVTVTGNKASGLTRADKMRVKELGSRNDLFKDYVKKLNKQLAAENDTESDQDDKSNKNSGDSKGKLALKALRLYAIEFTDDQGNTVPLTGEARIRFHFQDPIQAENIGEVRAFSESTIDLDGSEAWIDQVQDERSDTAVHAVTYTLTEDGFTGIAVLGHPESDTTIYTTEGTSTDDKDAGQDEKDAATGTITAADDDYKITLTYDESAQIPQGASLDVSEIAEGTDQYNKYLQKAKEAFNENEADANKTVKDLKVRFFDIKIKDGKKKIQPDESVQVQVTADPVKVENADDVKAVHFQKKSTEILDTNAKENKKGVKTVSFDAESFSVYGIVYTVDFEYENPDTGEKFAWSWPGEGSYSVASIMSELGIYDKITEVTLKRVIDQGGDDKALFLEKKEDGWYLTSEKSFKDTFELTVLAGEKSYVITVTDVSYLMKDAVSSVSADGLSGSDWTVKAGEKYTIHLSFEETPSVVQFPTTNNSLKYQLPENFKPNTGLDNVPVVLTYSEASVTHTLTGCTYSVSPQGLVTINLTEEAKQKLGDSGDGKLNINITGEFTETNTKTDFGGGNVKNITVDDKKDVIINKEGSYNSSDNKVHYKVTVKADGSLTNVHVQDTISGSALSMDTDSIRINGNSSGPNPSNGGAFAASVDNRGGFDMTFPSMKNGETITIEYTASVDWNVIGEGKGNPEQTGNSLKVKPNETDEKTKDTNLENRISYNPLSKSADTPQDTADPDTKTIPWTITVNDQGLKNMQNTTITDHNQSSSVMHYAGRGITIDKIDTTNGQSVGGDYPKTVTWEDLGIEPESADSWQYKITDSGNYKYVITYTTEVDVTGKNGNTYVSNYVDDGNGDSSGSSSNVPPGSSAIGVHKTIGTVTKEKMTWTVVMDVPATGLNKAILVDTLPRSGKYQDTLDLDSLNVSGLESGDSYELTQSKGKFTLTFFKDAEHENTGLNGTGRARNITVTFSTDVDPTWAAESSNDYHKNDVSFQGDNSIVYDSDRGKLPQRGIEKISDGYKKVKINGEEKLVFIYAIDLFGLSNEDFSGSKKITVVDDFDDAHLQFLNVNTITSSDGIETHFVQRIKNAYGGERGDNVLVPQIQDGKLTFTISKSDFYDNVQFTNSRFRLTYLLVAKNSTNLLQESLGKEDHIVSIGNKVTWDDFQDDVTVDYSYPGVTKENIAPSGAADQNVKYDPNKGTTGFKIVINPDKLELNNGDPMVLEDVFTDNLSVDYSSIKIDIEPATDNTETPTVTYDYKGNKGIYNIPDKCKVTITYDARVIGNPSEWVSYGNTATMKGFTDSASGRAQMAGGGDGGFNIYSVDLFKYSAGHMEQGLNGATFTLVDENGNPVLYPETAKDDKAGKPITFTTESRNGKPGYARISLSEEQDGISLQKGITYYLKETVSPATHAINNTTYRFTISDNPNYSNYEYHAGDIVKVYDWPIMGRIEINKEIDGPENLTEEDKKKITFTISGKYSDGSSIKVDDEGYPIELNDLNTYSESEKEALKDFEVNISYADFTNGKYTMADLVNGTYTVKETAAALPGYNSVATSNTTYEVNTAGTRVDDNQTTGNTEATVTITNHSKYVMNYKNTYTGKTGGYDLIIKKVDKDNSSKTLYGAVFRLEKKVDGEYQPVKEGSVNENGEFSIGYANKDTGVTLSSLTAGDYRITEIQAPANYKAMTDATSNTTGIVEFTIDGSGNVTTTKGNNTVTYQADTTNNDVAGTYSIKNETKHSYTVTKVDGANVSLKLPGAKFGVWKTSYKDTENNITEAINKDKKNDSAPLWTYETDENGRFEILREDYTGDQGYQENTIYYFKEIEAPEGYELPDDTPVNYFYFSYSETPPTAMKPANLGSSSRSQTITNDLPDLEVKKLWKNLKGDNLNKQDIDVDSIDFVVYQTATVKKADGTVVSTGEEKRFPNDQTTYTIEYVSGNWSTVSIPDAPAMGKTDNGNFIYYTYRVEEDAPEGWVSKVDMSDSGREATITNTPEPMEITVKKVWKVPSFMDVTKDNPLAQLRVYQKNDSGEWVKYPINNNDVVELNKSNNWERHFQVEKGKEYKIVEDKTAPDHWPLSKFETTISSGSVTVEGREFEFGESGEITFTNTWKEPYLEIKKIWDLDQPDNRNLRPKVTIYRREIGAANWTAWKSNVPLQPEQGYIMKYQGDQLEFESGKDYEFYIVETSAGDNATLGEFYTTYSHNEQSPLQHYGTITVTNASKHDGKLIVDKVWEDSSGQSLASEKVPNNVKVILQRAEAEEVGCKVTLNAVLTKRDGTSSTKVKRLTVPSGTTVYYKVEGDYTIDGNSWKVNGNNPTEYINSGWKSAGIKGELTVNENTIIEVTAEGTNDLNPSFTGTYDPVEIKLPEGSVFQDVSGTEVTLTKPNWQHTWENLETDAGNGNVYVYNVREVSVNGRAPEKAGFISVVDPADGTQNGTVTLTNKEIAKGSLKLTKNVTIGGNLPNGSTKADGTYTFRVTDSAGTKHIVTIEISGGVATSGTVAGEPVELNNGFVILNDLPVGDCTVQEINSTNSAVKKDLEPHIVKIIGGTTATSTNIPAVTITNNYDATGSVPFKAKKNYAGHTLKGEEFSFTLKEYEDAQFATEKTGGVQQTKTNDAKGDVIFDNIEYTLTDAGSDEAQPKTYYYIIKETPGDNPEVVYDETEYKVTVAVYDKGDGTLNITKTVTPEQDSSEIAIPQGYDAQFNNEERQLKDFEFYKKWRNNSGEGFDEWADGKSIEVTIQRRTKSSKTVDNQFKLVYSISKVEGIVTTELTSSTPEQLSADTFKLNPLGSENNFYRFGIGQVLDPNDNSGEEYEYFVKETQNAEGYSSASYAFKDGQSKVSGDDINMAKSEEGIINTPENAVELPSTGGSGTKPFILFGLLLMGLAGAGFIMMRRRRVL